MKQTDIQLQVGVKIILKNGEGKVLLLRRSEEKYGAFGDMWDIPGGRINPGSELVTNLRREIQEETGLIYAETPSILAAQDILRHSDKHVVRITYSGHIEGEPVLDEENTAYKWVTLEEMSKMNDLDQYVRELLLQGLLK